ncbi:unnamed protein product [Cuscuta campestris]|nr:unnamed protein product [Cuscuta campestris]
MPEGRRSPYKDGIDRTFSAAADLDGIRLEEDAAGDGGNTRGGAAEKVSISATACSAVLLAVVCFAISLAIVLLVNCVNKSICPVRRSLRKTAIASAIFLVISSTAAVYLAFKVVQSVRIYLKM